MKVAVLGPRGTFSHELAESVYDAEIITCPTINSVFALVETGECRGLVPVENSEAGGVGETLDNLMRSKCRITAEYYMPVRHHLATVGKRDEYDVIYAHPQSHEQCSEFIEKMGLPVIHTSSNARSAEIACSEPGSAAITSRSAARIFGLLIVREDVQNSTYNTTRFIEISADATDINDPLKCSIIIDPRKDRPGLLFEILSEFAKRKVNLSRIESRPSKRGIGSYVFFIDFNVSPGFEDTLDSLGKIADLKLLGCYRRMDHEDRQD